MFSFFLWKKTLFSSILFLNFFFLNFVERVLIYVWPVYRNLGISNLILLNVLLSLNDTLNVELFVCDSNLHWKSCLIYANLHSRITKMIISGSFQNIVKMRILSASGFLTDMSFEERYLYSKCFYCQSLVLFDTSTYKPSSLFPLICTSIEDLYSISSDSYVFVIYITFFPLRRLICQHPVFPRESVKKVITCTRLIMLCTVRRTFRFSEDSSVTIYK